MRRTAVGCTIGDVATLRSYSRLIGLGLFAGVVCLGAASLVALIGAQSTIGPDRSERWTRGTRIARPHLADVLQQVSEALESAGQPVLEAARADFREHAITPRVVLPEPGDRLLKAATANHLPVKGPQIGLTLAVHVGHADRLAAMMRSMSWSSSTSTTRRPGSASYQAIISSG